MTVQTKSIDLEVPVRTAYNQWTQFETFPTFMDGVQDVAQIGDSHLRWRVRVGGVDREFLAEITEQEPDQRIAWHSIEGPDTAGVVTFHRLAEGQSRVTLQMSFDPDGLIEHIGDKAGFVSRKLDTDLTSFKQFVESRGNATGQWRGEIRQRPH